MSPSSGRGGKPAEPRADPGTVLERVISIQTDFVFGSTDDDDGEDLEENEGGGRGFTSGEERRSAAESAAIGSTEPSSCVPEKRNESTEPNSCVGENRNESTEPRNESTTEPNSCVGENSSNKSTEPRSCVAGNRNESTEPNSCIAENRNADFRGGSSDGPDGGQVAGDGEHAQSAFGRDEGATGGTSGADSGPLRHAFGKNVMLLQSKADDSGNLCSVYVVGTAHISQDSCDEVLEVIRLVKPQTVYLELCASRVAILYPQKLEARGMGELVNLYRKGVNPLGIAYSWVLARYAGALESFPGKEFRIAYEEALKNRARVVFGDRPIQITLQRAWARLSTRQRIRLIFDLIVQGLCVPKAEDLRKTVEESDLITASVQEMAISYPCLLDTILHERDQYMTVTLRATAWHRSKVVAVVGKGHLEGIAQNWQKDISVQKLLKVPRKKRRSSRPSVRRVAGASALCGVVVFIGIRYSKKT